MHGSSSSFLPGPLWPAWIACSLVLAACSTTEPTSPSNPGWHDGIDVQRYDLRGEFDWDRGRLVATVSVTLSLAPDLQVIALDSAVSEVKAVRAAGGGALPFSTDAAAATLTIDLSTLADRRGGDLTIEIDYEAGSGGALRAVPARQGDPIAVRAVYTYSEPLGAAEWMPCNDVPSDRALFSVDMRMESGESMIANGALRSDTPDAGSGHRVRYETGYTLPTYLMAFAISDFEVESATVPTADPDPAKGGKLPVSVWHRRGLAGDYPTALDELGRMIGRFEELLVPYPFEKYALVLLPDLSGGEEHASVTFQGEIHSTHLSLPSDLVLSAHELGHQWFGDLVTVETWDDLWIKEGMATVLENEGARVHTDQSGKGTLNGDALFLRDGDAVRDTSLAPGDKYNSGPYSRAAWVLTQIRSLVGEDAFWGTLRGVLHDHRFGSIGTDEFLGAFTPALGADAAARARRAVDARPLPTIEVDAAPSGGALVTLRDPGGALIAPMEVVWIAGDGATRTSTLAVDEPVELSASVTDELLIVDPLDRHPDWAMTFLSRESDHAAYGAALSGLRLPSTGAQLSRFLDAGGAHQLAALMDRLPDMAPEEFTAFVEGLDSEPAKAVSIRAACSAASAPGLDPAVADAWAGVIREALSEGSFTYGLDYVGDYGACSALSPPEDLFEGEWQALETGLSSGAVSDARLAFLSTFRLPAPAALDAWGAVARHAGSLRARRIAVRHLGSYAEELDPAELPAWRAVFLDVLQTSDASEVLHAGILGLLATSAPGAAENAEGLDALRRLLESEVTRSVHATAICVAYALTGADDAAFQEFAGSLGDAPLTPEAAELLKSPSSCG